ncbi:hypothetical protein BVG79_p1000035 (plasmid) [Ketogulonicigenium robustum]|uniref:Uncharacterized protein n=1 Tax=Ketogulonicigenium robustum TaxID=92947 RepID=A0A1W6P3C6_9RHOB|nr:hypothetical protein [Ketogulonicigenium robustum]ARO15837.1 hypothetical protein BVG79_p1000035 [Ketogulonicigenium robustum]
MATASATTQHTTANLLAPLRAQDRRLRLTIAALAGVAAGAAVLAATGPATLAVAGALAIGGAAAAILLRRAPNLATLALRADATLPPPYAGHAALTTALAHDTPALRADLAALAPHIARGPLMAPLYRTTALWAVIAIGATATAALVPQTQRLPVLPTNTASQPAPLGTAPADDQPTVPPPPNGPAAQNRSAAHQSASTTPTLNTPAPAATAAPRLTNTPRATASGATLSDALLAYIARETTFSADAPAPNHRAAARITEGLAARNDQTAEPKTQRPSAAMQVDTLPDPADATPAQGDTRTSDTAGTANFIPPSLQIGTPKAGQAIDTSGAGDSPRQDSLSATSGSDGAIPQQGEAAAPPTARPTLQEAFLTYNGILPENRPIRYLTEAERAATTAYHDVTAGPLPHWPRLGTPPLTRAAPRTGDAALLARVLSRDGATPQ